MKMLSVYDSKALTYMPPFNMKTIGEAIRAFETSCKDPKTQFYLYPADFTLVEIGQFCEQTGTLTPIKTPVILANAAEFKTNNI